ncbi:MULTISPECIES: hypothetical protein [unclassified Pseudomonas]|uniref:hypothetical protein n=1 Tax=unclassified Pseudomonas TaxID=196821 RepID=UPI001F5716F2|nr:MULTISPECIES: hypothetical protein [unclassified Pseudomonas]
MSTTSDTTNVFSMGINGAKPRDFEYANAFTEPYGFRISGGYAELEQQVKGIEFRLAGNIEEKQYNVEVPDVNKWVAIDAGLIDTHYSPGTLKLEIITVNHTTQQIVAEYEIYAEEDHPEGSGTSITLKGHIDIHYK